MALVPGKLSSNLEVTSAETLIIRSDAGERPATKTEGPLRKSWKLLNKCPALSPPNDKG